MWSEQGGLLFAPFTRPETLVAKLTTESSSRFEDEYSALLEEAGFKHEREVQFLEGEYADFLVIDFAYKERKIAVEYGRSG